MCKFTTSLLLCAIGITGLASIGRASDYVLINNLDVPSSSGTNAIWAVGSMSVEGQIIGDDPGNKTGTVPTTAATSGYAVSPFSLSSSLQGGATTATVDQVQIVMNLQSPTMSSLMTGNVYGAFYTPSANNSLSSATLVGGFFQFSPGVDNGTAQLLTATPTNMPVLNAGQTYWLVVAPKAGLDAQSSDSLTHYGVLLENSATALNRAGIVNTAYGTLNTELFEQEGADSGDQLTAYNAFFGTRIYAVSSGVPETSTIITALLGLVPIALLIRRRRAV